MEHIKIKMIPLQMVIILSLSFVTVSSVFLSDEIKVFHFTKIHKTSDEYNFNFHLDDNEIEHGKTHKLLSDIHFMFGANNKTLYWVKITPDEFKNENDSISKGVQIAEQKNDTVKFKDDFLDYTLTVSTGELRMSLYATEWNLQKICFKRLRNGEKVFNYTISSENNSRQYNGTTYIEKSTPFTQRIHLLDEPQRDGLYEVKFTENELNSRDTFCKGISKTIEQAGALDACFGKVTNMNLLRRLKAEE